MIKKLLPVLSFTTILLISGLPQSVQAGEALCVIKEFNQTTFRGKCNFNQSGGDGSFSIQAKSGLIANRAIDC